MLSELDIACKCGCETSNDQAIMRPKEYVLNYVIEITFLGKTMESNMASLE